MSEFEQRAILIAVSRYFNNAEISFNHYEGIAYIHYENDIIPTVAAFNPKKMMYIVVIKSNNDGLIEYVTVEECRGMNKCN